MFHHAVHNASLHGHQHVFVVKWEHSVKVHKSHFPCVKALVKNIFRNQTFPGSIRKHSEQKQLSGWSGKRSPTQRNVLDKTGNKTERQGSSKLVAAWYSRNPTYVLLSEFLRFSLSLRLKLKRKQTEKVSENSKYSCQKFAFTLLFHFSDCLHYKVQQAPRSSLLLK